MDIISRKYAELTNKELLEVYKLRSDVFVVEQKCVYPDPDNTDLNAIHVLSKIQDELAAYARIYIDKGAHIGRVIVHESHRNQGLAKSMMNYSIAWIKANTSKSSIIISAQVYLSDFYQSIGFEIQGSMYLEDGIPHLKMVYQL